MLQELFKAGLQNCIFRVWLPWDSFHLYNLTAQTAEELSDPVNMCVTRLNLLCQMTAPEPAMCKRRTFNPVGRANLSGRGASAAPCRRQAAMTFLHLPAYRCRYLEP